MGFFDFLKTESKQAGEPVELVSMYETKDEVIVVARLPGVSRDEINLNITPNSLTLKVERKQKQESEEKTKESYSYEKREEVKSFSNTVSFPMPVVPRDAKASFKAGVLEIRILKHKEVPKGTFVRVR